MDNLCNFCLVLLCFHARLFVDSLWSPAGKGLTSLLSFVMSSCDVVTFPLISWVRCGPWLYRFLIFALFLTLYSPVKVSKKANFRNRHNQAPHLIQDTTWESDKTHENFTSNTSELRLEVSPFRAGLVATRLQ